MCSRKKIIIAAVCLLIIPAIALSAVQNTLTGGTSFVSGFLSDTSALEVGSKRHTQYAKNFKMRASLNTDGYVKMLENDRLSVYWRGKNGNLRIVDRSNGYVWGSLPGDESEVLNRSWSEQANSVCTLTYYDEYFSLKKISTANDGVENDITWSKDGYTCDVDIPKLGISFSYAVKLAEDHITFSMESSSIREKSTNKLGSISFMPFLGAVCGEETDGYLFVPDGPGALIRFTKPSSYVSGYEARVYGQDVGVDILAQASDLDCERTNDYMTDAPTASFPVFGICHAEQNAFLAVIDGSEEYATVTAYPSGIPTDYSWAACRFDFRNYYLRSTGNNSNGVFEIEPTINCPKPSVSYYFLSGDAADYSGMAVKYRSVLKEQGVLKQERRDENLPLRLEVLGNEVKKGILWDSVDTLTTSRNALDFAERFRKEGVSNLSLVFRGWQSGGISKADYDTLKVGSGIGKENSLSELKKSVEKDGRFYLATEVVTANDKQLNLRSEAVTAITSKLAVINAQDNDVMFPETYFAKPNKVIDRITRLSKRFDSFNLSFVGLGAYLYSDYTRDASVSRLKFKKQVEKAVSAVKQGVAFGNINSYLWQYADEYFDIPVVAGQYMYETDTVPFLQIVLKGSVDYYAPYLNQGFSSNNSVLKMIEFGCYPSLIVTAADNNEIIGTPLEKYFSLCFDDWFDTAVRVSKTLSETVGRVEGETISSHKMVAAGVARVTYESGKQIFINYSSEDYKSDGVTVPANGWYFKE